MHRFFAAFSQDLPELLNTAAALHTTSSRAFAQGVSDYGPNLSNGGMDKATSNEWDAKLMRGFLLCRIGVLYGIAAAKFLRMRITTPFACIRIQCESLTLIKLMHESPELAQEWREIATDEQGAAFYRKYQSRVKEVLRSYSLAFSYDKASSLILHSRFPGITFGYQRLSPPDIDQLNDFFSLYAQEFNPDRPDPFLVYLIHMIIVQERIFSNLSNAALEIPDPL